MKAGLDLKDPNLDHIGRYKSTTGWSGKQGSVRKLSEASKIVQTRVERLAMEAKFFRFLKIVGVGFKARAESEGRLLYLKLGYSHEVELSVPPAVRVFCFKQNVICCTGLDKHRVHQFAAAVRSCKPPEVYKGKGIMYLDEVIKKKAGKTSKK
ncbi:hypothetical protein Leryth_012310 [Lithospermum erythrorhizon]|nr:hypothetical protein Leryth_012310 [Lithospermum erythrorhizon]